MYRQLPLLVGITLIGFLLALVLPGWAQLPPSIHLHLLFAVGIMPLILGAMTHFVPVLSRTGQPEKPALSSPLVALIAAGILVLSLLLAYRLYPLAAVLALGAVIQLILWIGKRVKQTLGTPHPGILWYQLALWMLTAGLVAILAAIFIEQQWLAMKRLHLHLNTLGFIGLTALGTLRVLLPTVAGISDPEAGSWLKKEWKFALPGILLIAIGSAWEPLLSSAGLLCLLWPIGRFFQQSLITGRKKILRWHGASTPLASSLIGLLLTLASGLAHAYGLLPPALSIQLFITAFLLPLVTGAASHLLPLWLNPQPSGSRQQKMRDQLGRWSSLRSLLFLAAGLLYLFNPSWALGIALIGLLHFIGAVIISLRKYHFIR
ncbi:MAG: NnrS family protein [Gammaproteobacteria bacterium]|nr:NnrS family protein [Gammaproteobacteria bacterium]